MKPKYYKTRKIKYGSGILKNIGTKIYKTVKRAAKIPNDVWKNRKNIKKSIKHIAKSKYIPTLAINPSNVHRILFKASNYIDFLDETSIMHLYCKPNENYNHDDDNDAEKLRQTDYEIKDLTEKYINLFRVGNSEENERNKYTLESYNRQIKKLKETKTSLEYNIKKCLSIEESQIYPFQPNQQEIDKRLNEDQEYKEINSKLNNIYENIEDDTNYLNSHHIQSSEDGEWPENKIKETEKNLSELETQKNVLESQMNAIYDKYNYKFYNEADDRILKTLKRFDFSKLNDAIITDVKNNKSAIFFWQPELFEFFHNYKYHVNRALWYGGWNNWTVIINEMSEFISNNDDIAIEYKNILWGTSGALKFLQQIFGNNNNNTVMSIMKGLTPEYINKLYTTNEKYAYNKLESDDNNIPDVDTAQYKQSMFTNITRKIRSYADKVGERISKTLGTNISKYRVMRKLLHYYDIDPGKYNMNILKKTNLLKPNYTAFMEREAKKAIFIAIYNLKTNLNNKITNVIVDESEIARSYNFNTIDDMINKYGFSLDDLLEILMKYNLNTNDIINIEQNEIVQGNINNFVICLLADNNKPDEYGETKQNFDNTKYCNKEYYSNRSGGNKSRKNHKMKGGSMLFFYNLNIIFKETYKQMIKNQFAYIQRICNSGNAEYKNDISKFFAQITRDTLFMSLSLCSTPLSIVSYTFGGVTPHCVISNSMALYFLFTMRIINKNEYTVKSDEVDKFNIGEELTQYENPNEPPITLLDIYNQNLPEPEEYVNDHYDKQLFRSLLRYINDNEYNRLKRLLNVLTYPDSPKKDNTQKYFLGLITQYEDEVKNQNKNNIPLIVENDNKDADNVNEFEV
jgi:hypothetical protein